MDIVTAFLAKMEEIDFPISYTDGIEEIYFTYLKNGLEGDYDPYSKKIRIGCNTNIVKRIDQIFVHEVGHHVDENEGFSTEQELIDEFNTYPGIVPIILGLSFPDKPSGLTGDDKYSEYFALGFELYHSHKIGLSEHFTVLYSMIDGFYKRTK